MSLERNKVVVRRFIEDLWNKRQPTVADDIFSTDCITHQLRSGGDVTMPRTSESVKQHVSEWVAAFPDLHITIEQMTAEGDRVMTHCVQRGTHLAPWRGIPASGKVVTIQMIVIHRVVESRIVEDWVLVDFLGVFQQFGIVPPTAELFAQAGRAPAETIHPKP
jgi:steroid delta-isomerase-like uncharacterized protein